MGKWAMVRLGDVCRPKQWKTIAATDLTADGYPVYGANGKIGFYNEYTHAKATVLVTCRGATCGTINVCEPYSYVNGNAMALDDLADIVDMGYLSKYLTMRGFSDVISGSAQPQIIRANIEKVEIPLPPLPVQQQIADVLDRASTLIEKRKAQIDKLDLLVKSQFVEMFETTSYSCVDLIDVIIEGAGLSYGIVQPGDDGTGDLGIIRPVDIVNNEIDNEKLKYIDPKTASSFQKTILHGNEVLVTVRGTTGLIAKTTAFHKGMNVTRGIAVIRYDDKIVNPQYLMASILSGKSQFFIAEHTRGATLQQINLADLRKLPVPLPPLPIQNEFSAFVQQVEAQKILLKQSLVKLELSYKSLVQKCFRGEVK